VDTLAPIVAHYRKFPMKLLAEKVESREEFQQCLELGFDYFQGYYFARPSIMKTEDQRRWYGTFKADAAVV
jgi:EAL and modified HD-GYP domain-containing signal transduction protein